MLTNWIKVAQEVDPELKELREKISQGEAPSFSFAIDGILKNDSRVVLPKDDKLRKEILDKAHKAQCTVHPGSTKVPGLKEDLLVVRYEIRYCRVCSTMFYMSTSKS